MKTNSFLALAAFLLTLSPALLFGQEYERRILPVLPHVEGGEIGPFPKNRAHAPQGRIGQPSVFPHQVAAADATTGLARNVTVQVKGSLQGLMDIDLQMTGCGPEFTSDAPVPAAAKEGHPPPIVSATFRVRETDDGYRVQYSIGARIAIPTGAAKGGATNFEFRDTVLQSTVILKGGKEVVLSSVNGKTLTLSIARAE